MKLRILRHALNLAVKLRFPSQFPFPRESSRMADNERQARDTLNLADQSLYTPSIRAAANPDPRVLEKVLQQSLSNTPGGRHEIEARLSHVDRRITEETRNAMLDQEARALDAKFAKTHGPNAAWMQQGENSNEVVINSPLLQAIRSKLPANVTTLLKWGADPNGLSTEDLSFYQALFLRFRPEIPDDVDLHGDIATRDKFLSHMEIPQTAALTQEEIDDRLFDAVAPFWSEEYFNPLNHWVNGDTAHSLVEAARTGSVEILDQVYQASPDCSFWMTRQLEILDPPTPSSLVVSTPLHAAIETRNMVMLSHLLGLGFDPNIQALAAPTGCTTPLAATTIQCEPWNIEAYELLASHPKIDFNIRTPVYSVHLLHFATARLSLPMLQRITQDTELKNAGKTALGHTLLHIVCLPPTSAYIQFSSEKIFRSIHEVSDLSSKGQYRARFKQLNDPGLPKLVDHLVAQTEVVKFLVEGGVRDLGAVDVHGNTPLHYLAGHRCVNTELIEWLRGLPGADEAWKNTRNIYGHTAEDLYIDAVALWPREEEGKAREIPEFCKDMHYSQERERRKEELWKAKLSAIG